MTATCQELNKRFEVITDKESELKALLKNARSAAFDKEEITNKLAELEVLRKDYEKYLAESTKLPDGGKIWATDYLALKRLGDANGEGVFERLLEKNRIVLGNSGRVVELNADASNLKRLDGISGLTALTRLWLSNNRLIDITELSKLTLLTELNLDDNQLTDVTALAKLTALGWLDLSNNQLTDVTALGKLTSLTDLYLSNNQLSDVTALGNLTSLTSLWLNDNQLTDITALGKLTSLTWLDLGNNQLSDVTALGELTSLTDLWLRNNPLTPASQALAKSKGWHL